MPTIFEPKGIITPAVRDYLRKQYSPTENARQFLIEELRKADIDLPDLQIEPLFDLVSLKKGSKTEYEVHLSWQVDETSQGYALGYCFSDFEAAIDLAINAGYLHKEGMVIPTFHSCLVKDFNAGEPLLCLFDELEEIRLAVHQSVDKHFDAAIAFST